MTPTSKPAVTPEMLEKARQDELIRKFFPDLFSTRVGPGLAAINETGKIKLRLLLASAVQDAVSEIANMLEGWQITEGFRKTPIYTDSERGADEMLRHVAAALREKYGVKP